MFFTKARSLYYARGFSVLRFLRQRLKSKRRGTFIRSRRFVESASSMEEDAIIFTETASYQTLVSIRALIINPHTSDSVISSVFEFLTRLLSLGGDSAVVRHVLKLLSDLASRRQDFAPRVFDSVRSNLLRLPTAESLSVLVSISERIPSLGPALSEIDGEVFASICLGQQPVSDRLWLGRNAERFNVPSSLLLTMFLGFTKDPYPLIRKAALDGLANLCKTGDIDQGHAVEGCYSRATELLGDAEDSVRASAVCAVAEWGKLLIASKEEIDRSGCTDAVVLQLCSMIRDMSVEVRTEAFKALGKIGTASEGVLLQTLSKKVLGGSKQKKPQNHGSNELPEASVAGAAGVFIHGLEDEFYEVREAAVESLCSLSVHSIKFSTEAMNRLMDMLYDDNMAVRLKTLETMHHMANFGKLEMHNTYVTAFLDAVVDSFENIRSVARKVLKLVKLPDTKLFKQCIEGILKSLEMYPQDEPDVLSALFHMGQNHANFSANVVKIVSQELEAASSNKSEFSGRRVAAFLVLGISAPLSNKKSITSMSPQIFSYSFAMLGRFSHALSDVMDQDTLLAYLSRCNLLSGSSGAEFDKKDIFFHVYKQNNAYLSRKPSLLTKNDAPESESAASISQTKAENSDPAVKSINLILSKIKVAWSISQSGCTNEALRALRACKREVSTFTTESADSASVLEFLRQYITALKLLIRVWPYFEHSRTLGLCNSVKTELLMGKLEAKLMEIMCRSVDLSPTEESHVMELVILCHLLKLSKLEICCSLSTMEKLSSAVARLELLHEQQGTIPSDFLIETTKALKGIGSFGDVRALGLNKLINFFSLEQMTISGDLRWVSAELEVPGNSPYNPISFVNGIPVAIPCEITLRNVSSERRLWLRISRGDETAQFVFLDPRLYKGGNGKEDKRFKYSAVVYGSPRAACLKLRISVGMESVPEEDVCLAERGHKHHHLSYLCSEREVHLSLVSRT
ncbi:PREDICTED: protein SIEL [Tarenaya hassleriana]|uniref:protein SIEL n=1 Tax=Tarenaya hassleriana TaxID=28532 RepID=UPI00053C0C0C|nr:PREDICTED: protein SIEL [Tarenaya hassleriana]